MFLLPFCRLQPLVKLPLGPYSNALLCHVVPFTKTSWRLRNNLKVTKSFLSFYYVLPCLSSRRVDFLILYFLFLDRKPGEVETITDLLMENWKNFPEARQLGEDSARFIRQEMESTWGQGHLAVLSEDEAQRWIMGVSFIHIFIQLLGLKRALVLAKFLQGFCIDSLKAI